MKGTIRESTLDGYRRDLNNYVKPCLGEIHLLKITPADLSSLYQMLLEHGRIRRNKGAEAGLSATTVHGIHSLNAQNQNLQPECDPAGAYPECSGAVPEKLLLPLDVPVAEESGFSPGPGGGTEKAGHCAETGWV